MTLTVDLLISGLGYVWPLVSVGLTWGVTELVNAHVFDRLGIKSDAAPKTVAYAASALLTIGYLALTKQPMTGFGPTMQLISTAVLTRMGASFVADNAPTQTATTIVPGK